MKKAPPSSFREYIGLVRPLSPKPERVSPAKAPSPSSAARRASASASAAPEPSFEARNDGFTILGARLGLEGTARELARGAFPLSDTIDLHGLTVEDAERTLARLCGAARGSSRRAVLVVHGKGTHSPGGRGVLRDEITGLLCRGPLARHVLCFATARPRDGGSGALYVLLAPRDDAGARRRG